MKGEGGLNRNVVSKSFSLITKEPRRKRYFITCRPGTGTERWFYENSSNSYDGIKV